MRFLSCKGAQAAALSAFEAAQRRGLTP